MKKVIIYTDGACSGNPGPGGYGAILVYDGREKEVSEFFEHTTNNRMEMIGVIAALAALKEPCEASIYSDSAYLVNAIQKRWLFNWQQNGWKTSQKKAVENQDLWLTMLDLLKTHQVSFFKVKGHSDNIYNNRCDELARGARERNT